LRDNFGLAVARRASALRTADRYSTGRQASSINPILFEADGGNDFHSRRTQLEMQAEAEIFRLLAAGS
jgi:hypothetical protein